MLTRLASLIAAFVTVVYSAPATAAIIVVSSSLSDPANPGLSAEVEWTLDLSNPKRPRWLNQYEASGATYGLDIVAAEGGKQFAYIADGHGGLKIVEMAGSFNGTLTHHIPIDGFAVDVRVDKGYAYIAADESGLVIVDLRDANRPRLVSRIGTPQPAWGLEIDGGYACSGGSRSDD